MFIAFWQFIVLPLLCEVVALFPPFLRLKWSCLDTETSALVASTLILKNLFTNSYVFTLNTLLMQMGSRISYVPTSLGFILFHGTECRISLVSF